jgi:hypothetical protein
MVTKGTVMKLLYLLPLMALGWMPATFGDERPAPDYSEYVYLHVTRGEAAARVSNSCSGRLQYVRS